MTPKCAPTTATGTTKNATKPAKVRWTHFVRFWCEEVPSLVRKPNSCRISHCRTCSTPCSTLRLKTCLKYLHPYWLHCHSVHLIWCFNWKLFMFVIRRTDGVTRWSNVWKISFWTSPSAHQLFWCPARMRKSENWWKKILKRFTRNIDRSTVCILCNNICIQTIELQ